MIGLWDSAGEAFPKGECLGSTPKTTAFMSATGGQRRRKCFTVMPVLKNTRRKYGCLKAMARANFAINTQHVMIVAITAPVTTRKTKRLNKRR